MKNNNLILMSLSFTLSIIVVVMTSLNTVYAQENQTMEDPKFFVIQQANSGSISEINETAYLLKLNDVSDKTILFSDMSDRIVKSIGTFDFVGNW